MAQSVICPVCSESVPESIINDHLDNSCSNSPTPTRVPGPSRLVQKGSSVFTQATSRAVAPIFSATRKRPTHTNDTHSSTAAPDNQKQSERSALKRRLSQDDLPPTQIPKRTKSIKAHLQAAKPLAERLRPDSLEDFVGHKELTAPDAPFMTLVRSNSTGSLILWGPPGCGKTTLARLIAKQANSAFRELSATGSGVNDVRAVFEEAKNQLALTGRKTMLFFDEVHRFNRAQQDVFLPYLEQGHIQLIGATTENPSFKLNGALLSRCRVFVLDRLTDEDIHEITRRAIARSAPDASESRQTPGDALPSPTSSPAREATSIDDIIDPTAASGSPDILFPPYPQFTRRVLNSLISLSAGDARTALSLLELVLSSSLSISEAGLVASLRRSVSASYDRTGESHYDMISALHKSVRGSNGSAAMYWLARMLVGGEDPMYIARRMVVCASEDIGLADNHALPLAMSTLQACQTIGMPECRINLAHLVAYLSEAPKSTRAYEAYNRAEAAAKLDQTIPVPMGMRNAPTKLMKDLGYSKGYSYNPDYIHPVTNDYLPISFRGDEFLKKEGDLSDKTWDENALRLWELEENGGKDWEGRAGHEGTH